MVKNVILEESTVFFFFFCECASIIYSLGVSNESVSMRVSFQTDELDTRCLTASGIIYFDRILRCESFLLHKNHWIFLSISEN